MIWSRGFTDAEAAMTDSDRHDCSGSCGCTGRMESRGCEPRRVVRKRSTESGVIVRCRWTRVGRWVFGSGMESCRILGPPEAAVSVPVSSVPISSVPMATVSGSVGGAREGAGPADGVGGVGELSESSARSVVGGGGGVHSVDIVWCVCVLNGCSGGVFLGRFGLCI